MTEPAAEVIRVEGVGKNFGPVNALADVNLHVRRGEVLGLIGDNGAGKSTLIKILTGYHQPSGGRILFEGKPVTLKSVVHARSLGIETVFQDLAMVDELPVYLNLHLNRELTHRPVPFLRRREMKRLAREALDSIGISIPSVAAEVGMLSGGQRQAIAVARSVYSKAKLLLLDEPLAAMGAKESAMILRLLRELKQRGDIAIILIAHNYGQVMDVCDRVNLLQHGEITFDRAAADTSVAELLELVNAEYRLGGGNQEPGRP
ncbi:ABC-type sugar transport system ATPase subunit [Amycolatopsis lexingtonensis]|uniref:ABC-type sugar transport system ATPase subunit n=1 Tax=Amycolatopsis lexingtonensis TaxID=218822 RepID=A0ABR9HYT0_9PSEU|nr:ATP-binding cassette domain-containing protein [Amycolatopsis lexingtonensis]MBE1495862.1 ABC-type sugar transport system ATPase subunit [Amycolatopsis lexingtonensis]